MEVLLDRALKALFEVIASGDILDKECRLGDLVGGCAGPGYRHLCGIVNARAVIYIGVWG
ncbi:21011_t:CDS:2, partial [Dentiscutata erythropus]